MVRVAPDANGVHSFRVWYPADTEELNHPFVNPDDFAGMVEPPTPWSRMTAKPKLAALLGLAVAALVVVACSVTSSAATPNGAGTWSGLTYDRTRWQVQTDKSRELLVSRDDPSCSLRFVMGGKDLPEGWSVDRSTDSLGANTFEVFRVSSQERAEYTNYFYQSGDPTLNLGGFQLALPVLGAEDCQASAEALLATLNPQGLIHPTATAAG